MDNEDNEQMVHSIIDLAWGINCAACGEDKAFDIFSVDIGDRLSEDQKKDYTLEFPLCELCMYRMGMGIGLLIACLQCGEAHLLDKRYGRLVYETESGRNIKVMALGSCRICGEDGEKANGVWYL